MQMHVFLAGCAALIVEEGRVQPRKALWKGRKATSRTTGGSVRRICIELSRRFGAAASRSRELGPRNASSIKMYLVFVGTVAMPIIFLMKTNTANGLYSKHSQRESWRVLLLGPFPHLRPWPPTHHSEKRVKKSFFTYKCGSRSSVVGTLVKELGRRRNVGNAVN